MLYLSIEFLFYILFDDLIYLLIGWISIYILKIKNYIYNKFFLYIGVIFYQNEDGDVTDIQADIIGPGNYIFLSKLHIYFLVIFI